MVEIHKVYKHFKGLLVYIEDIAYDSETLEAVVIYRELKNNKLWTRTLSMFESLVDKKKYPDVEQKYRFELVKELSE